MEMTLKFLRMMSLSSTTQRRGLAAIVLTFMIKRRGSKALDSDRETTTRRSLSMMMALKHQVRENFWRTRTNEIKGKIKIILTMRTCQIELRVAKAQTGTMMTSIVPRMAREVTAKIGCTRSQSTEARVASATSPATVHPKAMVVGMESIAATVAQTTVMVPTLETVATLVTRTGIVAGRRTPTGTTQASATIVNGSSGVTQTQIRSLKYGSPVSTERLGRAKLRMHLENSAR